MHTRVPCKTLLNATRMPEKPKEKLKKDLRLFDVYAICTGAMFSSGFFLLPGIATASAGPSTVLAYLIAGILILPAMFSKAELSTAMPRAGGTYYFLDRSLGPMAGTVGGLGTWLALVLKSSFALVGMGAYLVFFVDIPVKPLAVALTAVFAALNIMGAKETSGLQRFLVIIMVGVLSFFIVQGLVEVFSLESGTISRQFTPFAPFGTSGLLATVGLVFVSYAGLTKVSSVAEEVRNPDRNIPLGMMLSLATATFVYVVGVFIMVAVLDAVELRSDLTPVATAAESFFHWLPSPFGLMIIVIAAVAAFASTGNAGIMSASRYPLAMARDNLVTPRLAVIGRFGTPTRAILVTSALMIFAIVALDVQGIAKLASAFQLLIFALVNVAVIVMRESHIPSYVPGYRSPLYPWVQIVGVITPFILISQMGWLAMVVSLGIVVLGIVWYQFYVRNNIKVEREGAIYHLFARLGQYRYEGLDGELRSILKEKGITDESPFEKLVTDAIVLDLDEKLSYEDIVSRASDLLAPHVPLTSKELAKNFMEGYAYGLTPVSQGAALPHQRLDSIQEPHLLMVRTRQGLNLDTEHKKDPVHAIFFLVSPESPPGKHLRTLANIASRIDETDFMTQWTEAEGEQELRETLLRHDRYFTLTLSGKGKTAELIGRPLREAGFPTGTIVALIRRGPQSAVPGANTLLEKNDRLTVIGEVDGIAVLQDRFRAREDD